MFAMMCFSLRVEAWLRTCSGEVLTLVLYSHSEIDRSWLTIGSSPNCLDGTCILLVLI